MPADLDNAQGAGTTEIVSARRYGFRVTDRIRRERSSIDDHTTLLNQHH
jgi:hypothetical protein